jgi:hypothetical protein
MGASLAARSFGDKTKDVRCGGSCRRKRHGGPIKSTPGYLSLAHHRAKVSAITATARSRSNAGPAAPATRSPRFDRVCEKPALSKGKTWPSNTGTRAASTSDYRTGGRSFSKPGGGDCCHRSFDAGTGRHGGHLDCSGCIRDGIGCDPNRFGQQPQQAAKPTRRA